MFDEDTLTTGKWLSQAGVESTNDNAIITDFIKISSSNSYTLSNINTYSATNYFTVNQYDKNKNRLTGNEYSVVANTNFNRTLSYISSECEFIKISIFNYVSTSNNQLEQGSTATTYTPHKEQTFTFPLGTQRMYLGDYLADDGIHHVKRKISLPVSDMNGGSEDYPGWINVPYLSQDYPDNNQYFNKITNYMTNIKTQNMGVGINTRNQSRIILNKFEFNLTETQWKTQYPNLVFEIEYELATEEITPYTTEQQQAYDEIKQAISYEEQTNISGESDEAKPIFTVVALKNI